jgi:hypothetical protein
LNLRNPNGEADYQYCWKQFGDHKSKLEKSDDFGQGVSNAKVKAGARIATQRVRIYQPTFAGEFG